MVTTFKDNVDKFISIPGSFIVYTSPKFVDVKTISKYGDNVELNGVKIERLISTSSDELNWTPWGKITNGLTLAGKPVLYFKVMWKVVENPNFEYVTVKSLNVEVSDRKVEEPVKAESVAEYSRYERISMNIAKRESKLNIWANRTKGILVQYYRTLPDLDSVDTVLNEYSIKGFVDCKKLNIIVEVFPDLIPNYDELGVNVEKFEVFLDYNYFREIFGPGTKPRMEDRIYIPLSNMMYYIHSAYLQNGIRERKFTWVLSLLKHTEDADMMPGTIYDKIKEITVTKEDVFAEQMFAEMMDTKNEDQQTSSKKSALRVYQSKDAIFVNEKFDTNGNVVFNNYLSVNTTETNSVMYRDIEKIDKDYSISFLFNYTGTDCVLIKDKTNSINITNSMLRIGDRNFHTTLTPGKWYGVILNFFERNCEVTMWEKKPMYRSKSDTSLELVSTEFVAKKFFLKQVMLGTGSFKIANLRLWRIPVPLEYQSFVLTSRLVEKPSKTYLIDNFDPDVNLYNYGLDVTG